MKASCGWEEGLAAGEAVSVEGLSSAMEESATDEEVVERVGPVCGDGGWGCGGMRSQTIHHPRLVLQVRSSSWERERVSM